MESTETGGGCLHHPGSPQSESEDLRSTAPANQLQPISINQSVSTNAQQPINEATSAFNGKCKSNILVARTIDGVCDVGVMLQVDHIDAGQILLCMHSVKR
jgi:hypothetical protein